MFVADGHLLHTFLLHFRVCLLLIELNLGLPVLTILFAKLVVVCFSFVIFRAIFVIRFRGQQALKSLTD